MYRNILQPYKNIYLYFALPKKTWLAASKYPTKKADCTFWITALGHHHLLIPVEQKYNYNAASRLIAETSGHVGLILD